MEVIGGYRHYTSEEQDKWCKEHGVLPVHWTLKQWRNPRTESGYPVLGPNYDKNFYTMTREEAVALLERYSNYDGMGIPNLAGCKEAMKVAVEALRKAFPELAESEDERIRRTLEEYFGPEVQLDFIRGVPIKKIRDWLEKQKEQKPVVTHGETYHVDTLGTQQEIAGKMPQKPAEWSEEDENVYKTIMDDFNGITPMSKAYKLKAAKWLKSILERCSLQPKQEWSEEDERIRKAMLGFVNPDKGGTKYSSYAELVKWSEWLKSLRPSWKPSEEQMKAMSYFVRKHQATANRATTKWPEFEAFKSLYNELKKLM